MRLQKLPRVLVSVLATLAISTASSVAVRALWIHYMQDPWTRDGRVRANIIDIAPDVSGEVVTVPVHDNEFVRKGQLLMQIDPSHYAIAVQQAQAAVAAAKSELDMRRNQASRRADLSSEVVSAESRDDANNAASAAAAKYQQTQAELAAAKLDLERTRVLSPVDGYITNLQVFAGDYATRGSARLAVVDSHSFWVYGYFEETKLPRVRVGARAQIQLMSGELLQGHVEGVSRGIYDRDNPESRDLVANVDPVFNWVRLAQRVPVRIRIDSTLSDPLLSAGQTCTVVLASN
ncbi:Fusaric acid resistance protein fusE (plasmid) [Paraburkholderia caribensis MBA4]|uniref:Fusaric acid resistance protein fusE n=1 Tax=Paraburkholderia caribensis MBA4 TaxID=1323664 RepID=A0A0P0RN24_9BURK|nr:efflux RND transporter periplasmic adaptor subunit [Paraburkholderia caribensis]ALL70302.1 Fusaric acid resistance protein fusE [Paraburkholderia caribensis MBA4]